MTNFFIVLAFGLPFLSPPSPPPPPPSIPAETQAVQKKYNVSPLPVDKSQVPDMRSVYRELAAIRAKMAKPGKNEVLMGPPDLKGKILYTQLTGAPALCEEEIQGFIYYDSVLKLTCVCHNKLWRRKAIDYAPGREDGC